MAPDSSDHFAAGVDLFNAGRFFEAHEAWEQVWMRCAGAEKVGIQGLIQAAAAMVHLERGNREGAQSLYEKSREKLAVLPETYCGLDIGDFRRALNDFFNSALISPAGSSPQPPKLHPHHTKTSTSS